MALRSGVSSLHALFARSRASAYRGSALGPTDTGQRLPFIEPECIQGDGVSLWDCGSPPMTSVARYSTPAVLEAAWGLTLTRRAAALGARAVMSYVSHGSRSTTIRMCSWVEDGQLPSLSANAPALQT